MSARTANIRKTSNFLTNWFSKFVFILESSILVTHRFISMRSDEKEGLSGVSKDVFFKYWGVSKCFCLFSGFSF